MKFITMIHMGTIIRLLAVILTICFLFPAFLISWDKGDFAISGGRLLLGISAGNGIKTEANPGMITLLYIPLMIFLVWCIYRGRYIKDAALLSVVLAGAGLLGWLAVFGGVAFYSAKYGAQYQITAGYPICVLGYAATLILSFVKLYMIKAAEEDPFYSPKNKSEYVRIKGRAGKAPVPPVKLHMQSMNQGAAQAGSKGQCPICRQPIRPGFGFCTNCGSKV